MSFLLYIGVNSTLVAKGHLARIIFKTLNPDIKTFIRYVLLTKRLMYTVVPGVNVNKTEGVYISPEYNCSTNNFIKVYVIFHACHKPP